MRLIEGLGDLGSCRGPRGEIRRDTLVWWIGAAVWASQRKREKRLRDTRYLQEMKYGGEILIACPSKRQRLACIHFSHIIERRNGFKA
jgi:hypothetical protein